MSLKEGIPLNHYENPNLWGETYWNDVQLERARQTVEHVPETVHSILDIGCGAGIVTRELKRRFHMLVSLDLARGPLLQVKNAQILAIQGHACHLPFRERTFEAVVATELIEHLPDSQRRQTLNEMMRVSKRFILLTVPFREVLEYGQVKCAECGCVFNASRHTKSFYTVDMKSLLDSNWSVRKIQTFGPRQKRIPVIFIILAQMFGGYMAVRRANVTCPQCGNMENYISRRNWMTRLFSGGPSRYLPLPKFNNWIVVLYERKYD
ncbi:MAG: class I SAM-dependent methyltransferase [bacterium]